MNIVKNDITLRAIEQDDMQLLKDIINDPEIENMVVGWSFPVSTEHQVNWISSISGDRNNVRLAIDTKYNGVVGIVSLTKIDFKNRTGTINIKLNRENKIRRKGIGYKSINMLIDYAFNQLNLNCLAANILEYNTPSQKLFEKSGFVFEGSLRKRVFKSGTYQDLYSYSLLKSDFQ